MSDDDSNITRFPIRPKTPPPEDRTILRPFEVKRPPGCYHSQFIVDEKSETVECAECGERLNPMWVLNRLALEDSMIAARARAASEASERFEKRARTKCQHCGKITRIKNL